MTKLLTDFKLTLDGVRVSKKPHRLLDQILEHANGSLYRMNAKSADLYSFTPKGSSWEGGWSWSKIAGANRLVLDPSCFYGEKYLVHLSTQTVFEII